MLSNCTQSTDPLAAILSLAAIQSARAQTNLSACVDSEGHVDIQALTCAQLAGTWQEDADMFPSGWYDGLVRMHRLNVRRAKEAEHEVMPYCKAKPSKPVFEAIAVVFKDMRAMLGIKMTPRADRKPSGRSFPLAAVSDVPLLSLSFDQYSDMVIGATVDFLLTGPSQAPWSVGHCKLGSIVLQFGVEGGSKILHGVSRPDTLSFIFQDEQIADLLIFDGQILHPRDFVVLPPGSDFTFASCGIHRWMSISMPVGFFETFSIKTGRKRLAWLEKEKRVISPPEQLLECLTAAAASTAVLMRERQTSTLHGSGVASLNALITAIADLDSEMRPPTEKSRLPSDTVAKALKYARGQKWGGLQVADLALAADVTSRTLLRTFRQQLGVGPASYLKLRQLNMVRRALRGKCVPSSKVTNIMSEHGVSEFGRFASEYKALFGERPSETVARSRVQRAG